MDFRVLSSAKVISGGMPGGVLQFWFSRSYQQYWRLCRIVLGMVCSILSGNFWWLTFYLQYHKVNWYETDWSPNTYFIRFYVRQSHILYFSVIIFSRTDCNCIINNFQHLKLVNSKPSKVVIRRAGDGDLCWWKDAGWRGFGARLPSDWPLTGSPSLWLVHVCHDGFGDSSLLTLVSPQSAGSCPALLLVQWGRRQRKQILIESQIWAWHHHHVSHKPHTWR